MVFQEKLLITMKGMKILKVFLHVLHALHGKKKTVSLSI